MTLPDGEHTFLVLRFGLLSHDGVVAGLCTKSTDITDRKRREAVLIQREAFLREALAVPPCRPPARVRCGWGDLVRSVGDLGREHLDGLQAGAPMVSVLERLGLSCVEQDVAEGFRCRRWLACWGSAGVRCASVMPTGIRRLS
jgi:hypothetical protein